MKFPASLRFLFAALWLAGAVHADPPEPIVPRAAPDSVFPELVQALAAPGEPRAAVAVIFLAAECPLSRTTIPALNAFAAREKAHGILTLGIVPRESTGSAALADLRREQDVRFRLVGDPGLALAKTLGARVTPEALLLDSLGRVLYRGAIDDRAADLRRKRPRPTRNYLDTAAVQWRAGLPVSPAATRAVGCFIE